MLILKCKMCGGDLELIDGNSIAECQHCGSRQTLPNPDDEKKIRLFNQANKLRISLEFDRAASIYENIIAEFPEEAEGYWGLCLCNFGIEYVDDPATGEKKPTCHRASFEKLTDDENFKNALDYADMLAKRQYTIEAREIDRINEEILSVSKNEKPYDVFICYKETDENNERTVDSIMAEKLYDMLTDKGYKVFFSRISLEDKTGMMYEPYIFAALNSAKIMLCIGTKYEHFHAVWVKNEWGRFLRLAAKDKSKFIFPCYKDCDPYIDLPQEFKALQAQDLGKVGAENDLIRGIEKILGKKQEEAPVQKQVVVNTATGATTETFLKRAKLALESADFSSVNKFCESALNMDPENADAYLYKLLSDLKITNTEELSKGTKEFTDNVNYQRAYRFGDAKRKEWLTFCVNSTIYNIATNTMVSADSSAKFEKAANIFKRIPDFKDSSEQIKKCLQFKEMAECEEEKAINEKIYQKALQMKEDACDINDFLKVTKEFEKIPEYKGSKTQIKNCLSECINIYNEDYNNNLKATFRDSIFNTCISFIKLAFVVTIVGFILTAVEEKIGIHGFGMKVFFTCLIYSAVSFLLWLFFSSHWETAVNQDDKIELEKIAKKYSIANSFDAEENEIKKKKKGGRVLGGIVSVVVAICAMIPFFIIPGIKYAKGLYLYEEGAYDEAFDMISGMEDFRAKDLSIEIIQKKQMTYLEDISVGDTIKFGVLMDFLTKKGEEIKERDWLVLDIVGDKALIIENTYGNHSQIGFDGDSWEECKAREYLNNEFYNESFYGEIKDMILLSDVISDGNPDVETQEENSTQDRVFFLSINEAKRYFDTDADRVFLDENGNAKDWWLRTPGQQDYWGDGSFYYRTGVFADGNIGSSSGSNDSVIRAAMWIDISDID